MNDHLLAARSFLRRPAERTDKLISRVGPPYLYQSSIFLASQGGLTSLSTEGIKFP